MDAEKTYGLGGLCLRNVDEYYWHGLNTPSTLSEGCQSIGAKLEPTYEELRAHKNARRKHKTDLANIRSAFDKAYPSERSLATEARIKARGHAKRRDPAANARILAFQKKSFQKALDEKRFACAPCDKAFKRKDRLQGHLWGFNHRKTVDANFKAKTLVVGGDARAARRRASDIATEKHYCEPCDKHFRSGFELRAHEKRVPHKANVAAAEANQATDYLMDDTDSDDSDEQMNVVPGEVDASKSLTMTRPAAVKSKQLSIASFSTK